MVVWLRLPPLAYGSRQTRNKYGNARTSTATNSALDSLYQRSMYAITNLLQMPLFVGKGNFSQVLITRRNRGKSGLRLPLTDKYHLATADVAYTLHTDKSSEFEVELASRYLGVILTVIQSHLGRRQHIGLHVNELQFSCATKSGIDKLNCTPTPLRPSVYAL